MNPLITKMRDVLGDEQVRNLERLASSKPCLLLTGGQLTGKTSVARLAADRLGGRLGSAGLAFRAHAGHLGLDVEQLGALHRSEPERDIRLDFESASWIASGQVDVFEGRLAGVLGTELRRLGRAELAIVRLTCTPAETAFRAAHRYLGAESASLLRATVTIDAEATLLEALRTLAACPLGLGLRPHVDEVASRDERDMDRLASLYGVRWDDASTADEVIETEGLSIAETTKAVLRAARRHWSGRRSG